MHEVSSQFDTTASTLVRWFYLIGLVLSFFAFFSGVVVESPAIRLATGGMLAAALILHEFLEQRRVLIMFAQLVRHKVDPDKRKALVVQFKVHLGILAALVLFDIFNVVQFNATSATGSGVVPDDVTFWVRGAAIPCFFLLSSLLAPVDEDAGALLSRTAASMTFRTMRALLKQWKARLKRAKKADIDMAAMVQTLLEDAGDTENARRVHVMSQGLQHTEQQRPPKGAATKAATPKNDKSAKLYSSPAQAGSGAKPSAMSSANAAQNVTEKVTNMQRVGGAGRKVRAFVKRTPQERIWRHLEQHPDATVDDIRAAFPKLDRRTIVKHFDAWSGQQMQAVGE